MRKFLLLCIAIIVSLSASSQEFSNKGKDFWVGYGNHVRMFNAGAAETMEIYLTSDVNTTGNISIASVGFNQNFTVTANQITVVSIPRSAALLNEGLYNHGIHITAQKPIVAYGFIYVNAISGATVFLPTNTLGKNYYSLNYTQVANEANCYSYFFVEAVDTGTTVVEITPSQVTKGGWPANVTQTINLTQGQIYQVLSATDLTGSTIKSIASGTSGCKKIAVFCGSGKISIGCANAGSSDNLYQQMYPASTWGKKYVLIPSNNRPNTNNPPVINTNFFRIYRPDATTSVKLNGVAIAAASFTNNYYQFSSSATNLVEADKPILVAQYFSTAGCSGNSNPHDPEMVYLNPVEQTVTDVTVNSMQPASNTAITQHFINVVLRNSGTGVSSFKIDGVTPTAAVTILPQDNGYAYLRIYTQGSGTGPLLSGAHHLTCDSGFNAIAYGFGNAESYGYSAGTNLKDLYNFITPINPLNISSQTTACSGTPFYFSITYPFEPLSIYWNFWGYQTPNVTVGTPVADTTYVINGKQVWRYKLPTPYTYSPAGPYPVSITATTSGADGCGTSQTKDDTLYVYDPGLAVISRQTTGCYVDSVAFFDSTVYPVGSGIYNYQWQWNFGDAASGAANTSTLKNPKHKFSAPGTYMVTLTGLSSIGCYTSQASLAVTVTEVPAANFGVSSPICDGKPVTFSDSSIAYQPANLVKWFWDYGDGIKDTVLNNSNRIHTYTPWGNKTAKLKVETNSGCQSTYFSRNLYVGPIPFVNFNLPAVVCLPYDSAHFFDASTIADGSQAGFGYKWYFGDPPSGTNDSSVLKNPAHLYPGTGPFNVQLIVTSNVGCVHDTIKVLNNVYAQAHADFTVNPENCLNDVTSFTSNAVGSGNVVASYHWDFGDASTSALQNPTHTYSTAGTKTVKHWVVTDKGCYSDTTTKTVIINPLPTANFTSTGPFCETGTITFTDASVANAGNLTGWAWTFGDAGTSALQNPTHTYATAGTYTVTLTVTTNKGCVSAVYSANVVIHPLPVPDFTHTAVCLPYGVANFNNTSTVADGTALSYAWNFGDPGSGALNTTGAVNPSHYFSTVGPYTVTLTAASTPGCVATGSHTVADIYDQAHADFTVNTENCLNDITSFTSNAVGSGNAITEYHWDFGDATTSLLQNPAHTYLTAGTKTIKHWVVTDKGCFSDTTTKTIIINLLPTGNFNFNTPSCETRLITFTDASAANVGTLTNWVWNFNDPSSGANNASTLQNPTHTFAAAGNYNVTLTVTNSKGCVSAVFTRVVTINARPVAGYIVPEVCLSDTYAQFTDTTTVSAGTITNWQWNFGDPVSGPLNTSVLQNPTHSYTSVGSYTIQLIVTSNNGCKDTISHTMFVNGSFPVANFTVNNPTTLCANDSVAITNTSTVFPGTITKVEIYWNNVNFPLVFETDNFPAPGEVYKHLYPNFQSPLTKNFTIRFRAYSGGVCVNDKVAVITVNAAPKVQFNNIPSTCLDAAPYQITQASEIGGVPGSFVFSGPGVSSSGIFNPALVGPGTYTIKYTYTSTTGSCVDTASKQITVWEPPVANFGFSTPICETKPITFSDSSSTPVGTLTTWTWDFADGTPLVVRNTNAAFTHTFAAAGTYNVILKVTTSNGCVSTQKILAVIVKPQPKSNFTFPASVCLPNAVVAFANTSAIADGTALTYAWNFGDPGSGSNSSVATNPSHTYIALGPYNVNLQATSVAGCVHDTTIGLNIVHPQPKADFSINKSGVCIGGNVSFTDLSDGKDGTVNQWNWNFGDAQNSTAGPVVTHTYGDTLTYTISHFIINSHGCNSDTVSKTFRVYAYPVVSAGPDRVVLEFGSIVLQSAVTGSSLQYLWTPNLYLNDNRIATPTASNLLDDITYTLTVTALGGCSASDKVFVKLLKAPKIPNTFTPNGDGINDVWSIDYLDTYPGNTVQVFTRTGQSVFESKGYAKPWDGTLNGKPLPFDTYYYIIEPGNGRKPMTGYVTIVK